MTLINERQYFTRVTNIFDYSISTFKLSQVLMHDSFILFIRQYMIIADIIMVFAPVIGYISQYRLIKITQSVGNFSIDVCAILLTSNILRVYYWYAARFNTALLLQALFMICAQIMLLKLCIRVKNQENTDLSKIGIRKNNSVRFWRWNTFESYVLFLAVFSFTLGLITLLFVDFLKQPLYGNIIGYLSVSIQATLGFPQMIRNFRFRTVEGISVFLILTWFLGDLAKTVYFIVFSQPMQFIMCGVFQLAVDLVILCQLFIFRNNKSLVQQQIGTTDVVDTPVQKPESQEKL